MYHIIRDYWIKIDERNFMVMRKTGVNENGGSVFGGLSYWGTFADALEHIRKDIIRRKLKSGTGGASRCNQDYQGRIRRDKGNLSKANNGNVKTCPTRT